MPSLFYVTSLFLPSSRAPSCVVIITFLSGPKASRPNLSSHPQVSLHRRPIC